MILKNTQYEIIIKLTKNQLGNEEGYENAVDETGVDEYPLEETEGNGTEAQSTTEE